MVDVSSIDKSIILFKEYSLNILNVLIGLLILFFSLIYEFISFILIKNFLNNKDIFAIY